MLFSVACQRFHSPHTCNRVTPLHIARHSIDRLASAVRSRLLLSTPCKSSRVPHEHQCSYCCLQLLFGHLNTTRACLFGHAECARFSKQRTSVNVYAVAIDSLVAFGSSISSTTLTNNPFVRYIFVMHNCVIFISVHPTVLVPCTRHFSCRTAASDDPGHIDPGHSVGRSGRATFHCVSLPHIYKAFTRAAFAPFGADEIQFISERLIKSDWLRVHLLKAIDQTANTHILLCSLRSWLDKHTHTATDTHTRRTAKQSRNKMKMNGHSITVLCLLLFVVLLAARTIQCFQPRQWFARFLFFSPCALRRTSYDAAACSRRTQIDCQSAESTLCGLCYLFVV